MSRRTSVYAQVRGRTDVRTDVGTAVRSYATGRWSAGGRGAGRGGGGAPGGRGVGRGGGGAPGGCRLDAEDAERLEDVKRDAGDAGRLEDAELDAEEAERLEDADLLLPCVSSFVALLSSFLRGGSVDAPWRLAPRSLDGSSAEAGSAEVPEIPASPHAPCCCDTSMNDHKQNRRVAPHLGWDPPTQAERDGGGTLRFEGCPPFLLGSPHKAARRGTLRFEGCPPLLIGIYTQQAGGGTLQS